MLELGSESVKDNNNVKFEIKKWWGKKRDEVFQCGRVKHCQGNFEEEYELYRVTYLPERCLL